MALTTAAYRQAIDQAWDATATAWEETPAAQLLAEPQTARTALAQLFARGQDFTGLQRLDFFRLNWPRRYIYIYIHIMILCLGVRRVELDTQGFELLYHLGKFRIGNNNLLYHSRNCSRRRVLTLDWSSIPRSIQRTKSTMDFRLDSWKASFGFGKVFWIMLDLSVDMDGSKPMIYRLSGRNIIEHLNLNPLAS